MGTARGAGLVFCTGKGEASPSAAAQSSTSRGTRKALSAGTVSQPKPPTDTPGVAWLGERVQTPQNIPVTSQRGQETQNQDEVMVPPLDVTQTVPELSWNMPAVA